MAKKPSSFLDAVKALPIKKQQKIWFDDLDAADQEELLDFRRAFQAGEVPQSKSTIADKIKERFVLSVERMAILKWLERAN